MPRPTGDRSNDELDMLEIESKLRRRSFDVRFRFSMPYSSGEPVRFDDGKKIVLPEIDLDIKSDQLLK